MTTINSHTHYVVRDEVFLLDAIKQSNILQGSIDIAPPRGADLGHDATQHSSPGLGYSGFISDSPNAAMAGGDSQLHPRKSSKGNRVVKYRCVVCMDKYRVNKMIQAPNCMHFLCSTCIKDLFKRAIRNPEDAFPVQCCNANIPVGTVSGLLSALECTEYSRLIEDYNFPDDNTYCHLSTCREHIPPFSISRDSKAKCLKCHGLTCGVCKSRWHMGPCTHW
ncbi:hypothetical protein EV426DRAFT_366659 [Tirmania nivea]|nr:hypothetical protein EV426DRAFT_366659 [Tirmania nivea]